jgi:hypothetical protein
MTRSAARPPALDVRDGLRSIHESISRVPHDLGNRDLEHQTRTKRVTMMHCAQINAAGDLRSDSRSECERHPEVYREKARQRDGENRWSLEQPLHASSTSRNAMKFMVRENVVDPLEWCANRNRYGSSGVSSHD